MLKLKLLSLKVSLGSYETLLFHIVNLAKQRKSSYVCVANIHTITEARRNKSFREALTRADIVAPNGMPLSRSIKLLHGIKQEALAAPELLNGLFARAEEEQLAVFFYGGSPEILRKAADFISKNYPALHIAGTYAYPFRSLSEQERENVANKITKSKANIVFAVAGSRRQEKWMHEMKERIPAVMVGMGEALPLLVGLKKEPVKLINSYLAAYIIYTTLVISEKIRLLLTRNTNQRFARREIIEPPVQ